MEKTREVMEKVRKENVRFVELWFVDILGMLKTITIHTDELEKAFTEGIGFDGSSVEGFARIYESDLILIPEAETYLPLDWAGSFQDEENGSKTVRFFCSIYTPSGSHYEGDCRYVLKRALEKIHTQGYTFNIGPELEYFYCKDSTTPSQLDHAGYFDFIPADLGSRVRNETIQACERIGIHVNTAHHEVAPSQHEIDLQYNEAMLMADRLVTLKIVIKQIAAKHGIYATFMPKPFFGQNGSGLHIHQSLFQNGNNAFYDEADPDYLSSIAKSYIAGLFKYIPEITAVLNQWVNSYKRLVPGYEAPAYISWGRMNRSALVRVPLYKPGKESASRIELRSPDSGCNPYLAFAISLAAGFRGIEEDLSLPPAVEKDIFHMQEEERAAEKIATLPGSLIEAIQAIEKSSLAEDALGSHIFSKFIENKKVEWDEYRTRVTQYELETYYPWL
ncbi:MAG: glutamine synthetase family protein [Candidatus Ratteibacteria bacterium]|jgi:glutamine synthetase